MQKLFYLVLIAGVLACNQPAENDSASTKNFDEKVETAAIMKTIENETACFYKRDYTCWKENFVQADYAFQAWNNPDGTFSAKTGWDNVDKNVASYLKANPVEQGGSSHPQVERRNMIVRFFSGNLAYLVWDQYNSDKDSKLFVYSKDQRIMEKINGEWKIANVSSYWDYKNTIPVDSLNTL